MIAIRTHNICAATTITVLLIIKTLNSTKAFLKLNQAVIIHPMRGATLNTNQDRTTRTLNIDIIIATIRKENRKFTIMTKSAILQNKVAIP